MLIAGFGGHCAAGLSEVFGTDWADGAIVEALGCGEAAKRMGHSAVSWDMLGPDAFRVARQNGWLLERACAAGLDRLAASDAEAGSNLVESLRVYVACGGDANAAAERLCQHPNSVRNRVNRARAVLADGRRHGQAAVRLPVDDLPLGTSLSQSAACDRARLVCAVGGRKPRCGRPQRAAPEPVAASTSCFGFAFYAGLTFLAETVDQREGEPPWRSRISKSSSG